MSKISQATIIGKPQPKSWDEFERGCLATFGGGYRTKEEIEIFHHGIGTVFNLLRSEFPPAEQCKASTALLAALKAYVADHDDIEATMAEPVMETTPEGGWKCGCKECKSGRAAIAKAEGKDVLNPRA